MQSRPHNGIPYGSTVSAEQKIKSRLQLLTKLKTELFLASVLGNEEKCVLLRSKILEVKEQCATIAHTSINQQQLANW